MMRSLWMLVLCGTLLVCPVQAQDEHPDSDIDFTQFSLEELKNVQITSASKKSERLSDVPAAVFVITQEDIRRSGATSIPEVLRMAPGVHVARISATEWAVNIRGFNEQFSNKLLVLIDGRSVYTHVFSGVFWDIQDTVLEDVDRIEVIRGPNAALWGVNAVNGIINIITKESRLTQGALTSVIGGSEEGSGVVRLGGGWEEGYYRFYGKAFTRGRLFEDDRDIKNDSSKNDWRSARGGFRVDWKPNEEQDAVTLSGELYENQFDSREFSLSLESPYLSEKEITSSAGGGHLLSRWSHRLSETSETTTQFYYDFYDKDFELGNVRVHTLDLDAQHRFIPFQDHDLVWGLNGRFISDKFGDSFEISADPDTDEQFLMGAFVQDRIQLIPNYASMIAGAKLEHNDVTGFEFQPNLRLMWTPEKRHALWGAVSRAARIPSRMETCGIINEFVFPPDDMASDIPAVIRVLGDEGLDAETLIAYEIGYRFQPEENLWLSLSGFYNDYEHLIGFHYDQISSKSEPVPHDIHVFHYDNNLSGQTYGFELATYWEAPEFWRLQCSYSFLETRLDQDISGIDNEIKQILVQGTNPRNQISLRSTLNITRRLDLDLWFRYVDRLSESDVNEYTTLDARLAWRPAPSLELAVVGQNLLEDEHSEFSSLKIERSFYVKMDWNF